MSSRPARSLRTWLLTDVFPPNSGGSGWSTYYLGKALAARGHQVRVLRPSYGQAVDRPVRRVVEYGGLTVEEMMVPRPPGPVARAGLGKGWQEMTARTLLARRATRLARRGEADVLHGQHAVSATAAAIAARRARSHGADAVAVGTVRDYWPLCPTSTRLFTGRDGASFECKECHHLRSYLGCANRRRHSGEWARLPLSLARWAQTWNASRILAKSDAVIAVSEYVRRELVRSGRLRPDRVHSIPNLVDLPSVDRAIAGEWPLTDIAPGEPFLLFVGKWDTNKGPHLLPDAVACSGVNLPVVMAGEGPLGSHLEEEVDARGLDFRFVSWTDNDAIMLLMSRSTALLFPSAWQEPLSRVLLEGLASGAAIVALDTGGTRDAIAHEVSGWLARDMRGFSEGIKRVATDPELNARLRRGARQRAEREFAAPVVSARVEALYLSLLEGRTA